MHLKNACANLNSLILGDITWKYVVFLLLTALSETWNIIKQILNGKSHRRNQRLTLAFFFKLNIKWEMQLMIILSSINHLL